MDMPNIVSSEVHYGFGFVGIRTILGHHYESSSPLPSLHTRTEVQPPSLAALARRAAGYINLKSSLRIRSISCCEVSAPHCVTDL